MLLWRHILFICLFVLFSFCYVKAESGKAAFLHEIQPKSSVIIEGAVGGGISIAENMAVNKDTVEISGNLVPYGSIHLRLNDGAAYYPEIIIKNSGDFSFSKSGIDSDKKGGSYNSYYIKLPIGLSVPFFHYKSRLNFDFAYFSATSDVKLKRQALVNNIVCDAGREFSSVSSVMSFRLYLDTPVVLQPSIFEYSYFGIYYMEHTFNRTAAQPNDRQDIPEIFISTLTRTGGIFYDMKKDTPLKGLNFGISVYLGYGDMFTLDDIHAIEGASFGNIKGLIVISSSVDLSYRYYFTDRIGMNINGGLSYFVTTEFLNTADNSKYKMNMGGDLRYIAGLSFVFNY